MPPEDGLGYAPEMEVEELPQAENIIFGKPSRAKENKMKIKDITSNDTRVTLEGCKMKNCISINLKKKQNKWNIKLLKRQ